MANCSTLLILLVLAQSSHSQEAPAPIDAFLGKKYILVSSDRSNFNNILSALSVGFFKRMAALMAIPEDSLTKSGDEYTYSSIRVYTQVIQKFKPSVPFNHVTPDGRNVTSTMTIEGTNLHEVQREKNGRKTSIDRTFSDKELKEVIKVGGLVATRIYSAEQLETSDKHNKIYNSLMT